jgi:hypothetical protein
MRAVGLPAPHPLAQGRLRQIEIAGGRTHGLALVQHEPDRLGVEVLVKPPARPPASRRGGHSGHRIRLSEEVHEIGSSAWR